jgi:hypothetical protein
MVRASSDGERNCGPPGAARLREAVRERNVSRMLEFAIEPRTQRRNPSLHNEKALERSFRRAHF